MLILTLNQTRLLKSMD